METKICMYLDAGLFRILITVILFLINILTSTQIGIYTRKQKNEKYVQYELTW